MLPFGIHKVHRIFLAPQGTVSLRLPDTPVLEALKARLDTGLIAVA
jgi:hypothetical protein